MNENQVNKKRQKPVAWDTWFKWYASMSTFCCMPQICMHHLLPAACLPSCCLPVLAWPRQLQLQLRFACMTHSWPSLRGPVHICGFVRQYPQAISCSDCQMRLDQFAAFWPGLARSGPGLLQYVLVANWESDSAAGIKSSQSVLAASLTIVCFVLRWLLPQVSSLACNRFTFKSWLCRTHKDYTPNKRTTIASIRYLLDYKDL